jgi:hypothetical protein
MMFPRRGESVKKPFNVARILFGLVGFGLAVGASEGWGAGSQKPRSEPSAGSFVAFDSLESHQRELFLSSPLAQDLRASRNSVTEEDWQRWCAANDGVAAAFLAITHALELTEVTLSDGRVLRALDLIKSITEFKGDRIYAEARRELFEDWMNSEGRFSFLRTDGKSESGKVDFNEGNLGGSLHKGYDRQGYTSTHKMPRIQWNYRFADAALDIDLDGYAPLKFGWLPNPHHKTWENSDVRYWIDNYVKKFGDPGFAVAKH